MNIMTRANSEAWNAIAKTHYENYHVTTLLAGKPILNELVRSEVGDVRGKSLIHLLCHIGTDTLSWVLLGAHVTGVDISSESIKYARKIAEQLHLNATFIESDIIELVGQVTTTYDIVFASAGVLCWIPDIEEFATTVRQILKPGGFFYLYDGHPFRKMLGETEQGKTVIKDDYFRRDIWESDRFTDYTVKDLQIPAKLYEWEWTLGDVVTAFCQAGMRIAFLHEFPEYFYGGYTPYDVEENKRELYPCTFSLKVVAE
jgi:SAM-dependent methyltransferase